MPSRARSLLAICLLTLPLSHGRAAEPIPAGQQPTREQVHSAVAQVRADPNLAQTRRDKTLRFRETDRPPEPKHDQAPWLITLVQWITETARLLMWALGAVVVALLLVGSRYWVRARGLARVPVQPNLPSHVSRLDIRPESLPPRIGAAAAELWQRGQHRPCLSLLYRGMLSRLVHQHAVPILAASTEGECLALARARLDTTRGEFVAHLVRAWQRAVYGARLPDASSVLALCHDFDQHFDAPQ